MSIIVMIEARFFEQWNALPHFKYTTAVKNKAVYTIDGSYLLGVRPVRPQAMSELGTMIQ